MSGFRPMLAGTWKSGVQIKYPVIGSPKIDGIRCVIVDGVPVSRNLKPIQNYYIRSLLEGLPPLDGELIVGELTANNVWNVSTSGIMSRDGQPDFTFYVFDYVSDEPYVKRLEKLDQTVKELGKSYIQMLPWKFLETEKDMADYENRHVEDGYEGIMLRDIQGSYKNGRSTVGEGGLLKVKRFQDGEAMIIGFVEKTENTNESKRNALGYLEKSSKKAGKIGVDTLGALECVFYDAAKKTEQIGSVQFEIGTGFDDAMRNHIWKTKPLSAVVKFKYQGLTPEGKPRFPSFQGFRHPNDI